MVRDTPTKRLQSSVQLAYRLYTLNSSQLSTQPRSREYYSNSYLQLLGKQVRLHEGTTLALLDGPGHHYLASNADSLFPQKL